jgi:hypothetical protein
MQAALSPMAGRELRNSRKGAVAKVTSSAAQTSIGDQRIAQDDRIEVRRTFRPQRWFSGLNSRESPANVGNREWPVANRGSLNTLQIGTIRAEGAARIAPRRSPVRVRLAPLPESRAAEAAPREAQTSADEDQTASIIGRPPGNSQSRRALDSSHTPTGYCRRVMKFEARAGVDTFTGFPSA